MRRKHQLIVIVLLAIVIAVLGRLYLNAPIAKIQLEAEIVGNDIFGRWDITNSLIAAWIAMGIVLLVLFLATRKMTLVPRGVQNFIEFLLDFLLKLIEDVAGKKNGRRFFPLLATIFLFIVIANLTSLTPVFGTIGKVDSAAFEVTHALEEATDELAADATGPNKAALEQYHEELRDWRKHHRDEWPPPAPPAAIKNLVVNETISEHGDERLYIFDRGSAPVLLPLGFKKVKELQLQEWWNFEQWGRWQDSTTPSKCPNNDETVVGPMVCSNEETVSLDGKTVGVLLPFLRSANTDLMIPLGMALVAMAAVHYWGMRANGFFNYAGRFINFKQGPIMAFVGFLELFGEIAKIISFSFRLLGNTFAGEVLILAFLFLLPILTLPLPFFQFWLETGVAFIQAVVFMGLTLVFASLAVESHNGHGHKEEGAHAASSH